MPPAPQIASSASQIDIDRVIAVVRRRGWLMVIVATAAATVTLALVYFLPNIYRATVSVVVESARVPEGFARTMGTRTVTSRLQEVSQQVMNRDRLLAVVDKHGLYPELRARQPVDDVVQRMRADIGVNLEGLPSGVWRDGEVAFTITYTGTDAETVAAVANDLAATYIDEDVKLRARQKELVAEFLRVELDTMKARLETQEQSVKAFKDLHGSELPTYEAANLATLERLGAQLLLNNQRQVLAREPELAMLKAEGQRLERLIAEYEKRVERAPLSELEFRTLERGYDAMQAVYRSLLRLYEEANIAERFEENQKGERYRVLDPAITGERPVEPNRARLLLVGILLSLGLATIAAVAVESLDPTIHGVEELRAIATVPVVAAIPRIVTASDRHRESRRRWLAVASMIIGILLIVAITYFVANQNTRLAMLLS